MTSQRLPLTVIGGFLGAGKTTLLNHWLSHANAQRMAVLVNDFGAINVDADLIASSTGDAVALTNGCVCCQIGDDLSKALMQVLDAQPPFEAVIVEASGVSDPWRIAQMGRADPSLFLDGVVVMVDAACVLEQAKHSLLADTLIRQIVAADLIVVNHADRCSKEDLARIADWIRSVAGQTPQFETTHGRVPLAMLSGLALHHHAIDTERAAPQSHALCDGHDQDHAHVTLDHGAVFDTWSCRPNQFFAHSALAQWLKTPPSGLLRLKGIVHTKDETTGELGWSELQFAGRHGSVKKVAAPSSGPSLVAIGLHGQLPQVALSSMFQATTDHASG